MKFEYNLIIKLNSSDHLRFLTLQTKKKLEKVLMIFLIN